MLKRNFLERVGYVSEDYASSALALSMAERRLSHRILRWGLHKGNTVERLAKLPIAVAFAVLLRSASAVHREMFKAARQVSNQTSSK